MFEFLKEYYKLQTQALNVYFNVFAMLWIK
jgi:hypothetical protein